MDETAKKTRDVLGRWVKGVSGNTKGRPPKVARVESADLLTFINTLIEVNTPDGPVLMNREAALLYRLYQSAMKGNVHAQIFLARRFDRHHEGKAVILTELNRIIETIHAEKRRPSDWEATLFELARQHMNAGPVTDDQKPKVPLRKTRRGKRFPPVGKRDAGAES